MSLAASTKLIWNSDEAIKFASQILSGRDDYFGPWAKGMGVEIGGKLIAGIVYSNYTETPSRKPLCIEMSVGSVDKRWATRHNLSQLFRFPFAQLDLERVQTTCSIDEGEVILFNKRLGFTLEGRHRKAWHTGCDALSFGMLRHECKWL